MTEKGLLKYAGKRVKIVKDIFPHSIEKETLEGIITPDKTMVNLIRGGQTRQYPHYDFWIEDGVTFKMIPYNEVKLIREIYVELAMENEDEKEKSEME